MAFCPHCGKSVGEQASRCAECGGELEARGKPARFKGTMMMSPGTAPLISPPNAGQPRATQPAAQPAAAAADASKPSPIAATLPMPATGPIAEAAAAAAKKPAALKATMLGTGEAGLGSILQNLQAAQPAAPAAAPAAAPKPEPIAAAPAAAPAPAPAATTRREVQEQDDSKRFLVGDPMAPHDAPAAPSKPQRGSMTSRLSMDVPRDRSAMFIVVGIVGVCVIAALGYVAARLMGLAN